MAGTDITPEMVMASVAIVEYSNQTIRYLFWDNEDTGNPVANKVLKFLKQQGIPQTVTQIHNHFQRNLTGLADVLQYLIDLDLVEETKPPQPNGRSVTLYLAKTSRPNNSVNSVLA